MQQILSRTVLRPDSGEVPYPDLGRLLAITLPGQQRRRATRAVPTVGRHRLSLLAPLDDDRRLVHPPARCVAAPGTPLRLSWRRQATTAIAVSCLRRHRLDAGQ